MPKAQITIPLDIPDVRVLQTSLGERGELMITVESTKGGTACCKCGKWITKPHGRDERVTIPLAGIWANELFALSPQALSMSKL